MCRRRTDIIEAALSIESHLTDFLLLVLVGHAPDARIALARELIFDAEFCTFHQKWRMLKAILDTHPAFASQPPAHSNELKRGIKEIISARNKFAHGHFVVSPTDQRVFIQYSEGGARMDPIGAEEVEAILDTCALVRARLSFFNRHMKPEGIWETGRSASDGG